MANTENTDSLLGLNMPRGSYAIGGADWQIETGDGIGAPIIINGNGPGVGFNSLEDDNWVEQYGSSYDSFLSLVDGQDIQDSISNNLLSSRYSDSIPSTKTDNIWQYINEYQQIQYVVSGDTIDAGGQATESFGPLEGARGIAIRLPMMGVGYGRSKEMRTLFSDSQKMDRREWKTGSIDARWDDRRKTWATYNDLIVDHEGARLGTAVFSTNPDASEGFPLLKGRLEDVWWVRQPLDLDGESGDSDTAKTARIMTHLEHEFYDDEEKGSSALSSIFIVPHNSLDPIGTPDVCATQGEENKLGGETTGEAESIALKTEVGFWFDKTKYGPIEFGSSVTELGEQICCYNPASKLFVGEMIFEDEPLLHCDDEPRDVEGGLGDCVWRPAVRIDECQLVGSHFETFFDNDAAVAKSSHGVCMSVYGWSLNLVNEIILNDSILADGIRCNNDELKKVAQVLLDVIKEDAAYVSVIHQKIMLDVNTLFEFLVAQINAILIVCCDAVVKVPRLNDNTVAIIVPGKKIDIDDCDVTVSPPSPFDCNECVPIKLDAPCASNQNEGPFVVGLPCASSNLRNSPEFDNVGSCQTHTGS